MFRGKLRSTSFLRELRSPCKLRNSEFRNRDNGFESVRSKIDGPNARPTYDCCYLKKKRNVRSNPM